MSSNSWTRSATVSIDKKLRSTSWQKQPPVVFYKEGVLKNFAKFTGKDLCQSLFNKVTGLRPDTMYATLLKKILWSRSLALNFAKFSRKSFLENITGRLLLTWGSFVPLVANSCTKTWENLQIIWSWLQVMKMDARIVNLVRQQAVQNPIEDETRSTIHTSKVNFFLHAIL